ncbi:Flp pilus assembly protein CpaB [Paraburkholderia sp. BCC1884]|uniref:Flp pilus assembly protein CpaB n=1 Tax=Paraburkholderia sp. BCC1884 TaxID=2562668 RepID=UPI001183E0C0|nr:Flp pilus assembly protein CpaB [Paraburkholderia sp. BCC1884]
MFKKIKFRSLLGNSWVLLVLAVLVAGGLTFLLYKYLTDRETKLKAEMSANRVRAGIEVVVPMRDVPAGTPLSSGDFVSREISQDLVYDDMIRVDDFPSYRPAKLVRAVRRGLPLRAGDIDALRGRDFSDILPAGQRALTLEIDTVNSTADMVRPGNRVDIYWLGKVSRQGQSTSDDARTVQLMMPNVLILATGQDVRPRDAGEARDSSNSNPPGLPGSTSYSTVTVQVPVSEAPRIALAQKLGSLRLILRNADDTGTDIPKAISENTLFGQGGGDAGPVVELITGGGVANTLLTPDNGPAKPPGVAAAALANADPSTVPLIPSMNPVNGAAQPSVREQANAIAQQLQKAIAARASNRN